MKGDPQYRGINNKMDSTVMQYDQQHKVGALTKKIILLGRGGFTHLRERDNKIPPKMLSVIGVLTVSYCDVIPWVPPRDSWGESSLSPLS
jgi:hypothetical protein